MYPTDSLLTFSFPTGRVLGVPLRLSFLIPVVVGALIWRLQDPLFGILAGSILLLSLLAHEFAHILVARCFQHHPGSIVVWPLGGLHLSPLPYGFRSAVWISLAGPLTNFLIAAIAGIYLYREQCLLDLLNPFAKLDLRASHDLQHSAVRVVFLANWCLALFNCIPVRPLDAGQIFAAFLNLRFLEIETRDLTLRLGIVLSLFGLLAGFVFDISSVVALSAFLFVLHIHEAARWYPAQDHSEEAFSDYEFSTGRPSEDREQGSEFSSDTDPGYGILERWKSRREEERFRRDEEERLLEEQQLDVILEKLHSQGHASLTPRELGVLDRVSARLRQRNLQEP